MHQYKSSLNASFYLRLALFLFLLASVYSLLALTQELAYIFSKLAFHPNDVKWNQAALDSLYKIKPFEFTFYLMGCCFCCIYSGYAYKLIFQQHLEHFLKLDPHKYPLDKTKHQVIRIILLAIAHFLYGYVILATSFQIICFHIIYWIFLFQLPRLFSESQSPLMKLIRDFVYRIETYDYKRFPSIQTTSVALIILAFLEFLYLLFPFFEQPKIMNDFLNLPEITIIDGISIDNPTFIESHHLLSLHSRYDPRHDLGTSPTFSPTEFFRLGVGGSNFTDLFNNPNSLQKSPAEEKDSSLVEALHQQEAQLLIDQSSEEESLFLSYNFIEIHWQLMNTGILHHQGHFYLPANDFDKGRNTEEIATLYGRFTIYLSWFLMHLMGGISIRHVYIVSGIYYLTYYLMLVIAAKILCEKWEYASAMACLGTFCHIALGFFPLYVYPGCNPIRHYFDIIGLLCFYNFSKTKNIFSILAVIMALFFEISNDKAFGLMLAGAFFISLTYHHIKFKFQISTYVSLIGYAGILGLGIFTSVYHSGPGILDYFILGIGAYRSEPGAIFNLLFVITCLITLVVSIANAQPSPLSFTVLFLG